MKNKLALSISFLFLLTAPTFVSGQNHSVQLRISMIGDHYEGVPSSLPVTEGYIIPAEDKNDINTHLFNLRKGVPASNRDKNGEVHYSYYYLGIGYIKYYGNDYFFRIRVDRFSIKRRYSLFEIDYNDTTNSFSIYTEHSKSVISTMQYTGGIGKKISWKFLDFLPGIEMLLHYRGDKEEIKYTSNTDTTGTKESTSYVISPGGNFIGFSLLGAVNINLTQHIAIGLEASAGMAGANFELMKFALHYPSLSLSYTFGNSEKPVLFRKDAGGTSP